MEINIMVIMLNLFNKESHIFFGSLSLADHMHTQVNTHYYWKYRNQRKWIHLSYVRIYYFIILAKGRRKLAWTFCLLVSSTLFFKRLYKTLQSVILNNIENQKYMENLKISFLEEQLRWRRSRTGRTLSPPQIHHKNI